MILNQYVSEETREIMEKQFAECMDFGQLAVLFADFQRVLRELMLCRNEELTEGN